ncbi:MAG: hypothetical protein AAB110_09645, partial [Candidatus Desantisbacteria bacterium]
LFPQKTGMGFACNICVLSAIRIGKLTVRVGRMEICHGYRERKQINGNTGENSKDKRCYW